MPAPLPLDSWATVLLQSWVIHPTWTAHQHVDYMRAECPLLPYQPTVWRVQEQLDHYRATRDPRSGQLLTAP